MDKQKYQIKSTPFMRRLVSKSKKNGELQRLKDEYERIKFLNERMIQVRMRQMRLKRLYRVIEIIKNAPKNGPFPKQKTIEELRAEQILKARQLGQEYSRQNALQLESTSNIRLNNRNQNNILCALNKTRSRILKRIEYGNQRSRINMEEMNVQTKPKPPVIYKETEIKKKRELLQQRIIYGNSCSHSNLLQSQRNILQAKEQEDSLCRLNWLDSVIKPMTVENMRPSLGSESKKSTEVYSNPDVIENASTEQDDTITPTTFQYLTGDSSEDILEKLEHIEKLEHVELEDIEETDSELKCIKENVNLLKNDQSKDLNPEDVSSNEVIIKSQCYNGTFSKSENQTIPKNINFKSLLKSLELSPKNVTEEFDKDESHKSRAVREMCRIFEH